MLERNGKLYARVSDVIRPFTDFAAIDPEVLERKGQWRKDRDWETLGNRS